MISETHDSQDAVFSAGLSLPLNIRLWGCENKVRNTGEFDFSVIGITTVRGLAIKGDCLLIQTHNIYNTYIIYMCVFMCVFICSND